LLIASLGPIQKPLGCDGPGPGARAGHWQPQCHCSVATEALPVARASGNLSAGHWRDFHGLKGRSLGS
jgi:hypothetical protein